MQPIWYKRGLLGGREREWGPGEGVDADRWEQSHEVREAGMGKDRKGDRRKEIVQEHEREWERGAGQSFYMLPTPGRNLGESPGCQHLCHINKQWVPAFSKRLLFHVFTERSSHFKCSPLPWHKPKYLSVTESPSSWKSLLIFWHFDDSWSFVSEAAISSAHLVSSQSLSDLGLET